MNTERPAANNTPIVAKLLEFKEFFTAKAQKANKGKNGQEGGFFLPFLLRGYSLSLRLFPLCPL
jgi:hypothetical protein